VTTYQSVTQNPAMQIVTTAPIPFVTQVILT